MNQSMKKPMTIMIICVIALFGIIFLIKGIKAFFIHEYAKSHRNPIVTVSAMKAEESSWSPQIEAIGSLRTTKGVNVTTELSGMIVSIHFTPGSIVKKGDVLAQLDIAPDIAQLHALQAQAKFDEITYHLNQKQYPIGAVSKETLDQSESSYKSSAAQVVEQLANIDKKTIRAPFAGRLGISQVNLGQFLQPGDAVVTIQTLDPIYDDFYLPQEQLSRLAVGQTVKVKVDTFPQEKFVGKITTINPIVDTDTRNVEAEITLPNPKQLLVPGMFNEVVVHTGKGKNFLTLPQTAVTFNSYGNVVYILQKTSDMQEGQAVWKAMQSFVITGKTRGDQIQILKGLNPGEIVVTSGQLKLKNGSLVVINNSLQPPNDPNPHPEEE